MDEPVADRTEPSAQSRVLAALSQVSIVGCQVVLPAILRFGVGRHDAYVRYWATQALNLQLVLIAPWLAVGLVAVQTQATALGLLTLAYFAIVGTYSVVVCGVGAVKAWRGEVWEYPINIALFRPDEPV